MSARKKLVVIGNGMAAARTVEEILDRGGADQFEITMFGEEPHGNYNRISLSNVLAGVEDPDGILLNPRDWYEQNGIELRAPVRVTHLDRFAQEVTADDGSAHRYDKLIIATGSRSFFPPIPGLLDENRQPRPGIFGFRSMADTQEMLDWARDATRAVVIGGGLLGLEAARGLLQRDLEVHLVHVVSRLMDKQLDEPAAAILRRCIEDLGVHVHLETSTSKVIVGEDGRVAGLQFDETELECDMVVVTAGVRPNVELAVGAGMAVERAIVVDDSMRADDERHIYVVGECAQHRGAVYGLVAPLWEQAVVLAEHITGTNPRAAYHGSKIATKLKVSGVDLATMGLVEPEREDDEFIAYSEPKRRVYTSVIVRDGKLVGATLLGDVSKVSFLMQAYDRGMVLPEERRSLLFDLGAPAPATSVAELADDAQICNCNGVTKGTIAACVRDGARTMSAVSAATRAGSGCGSCKGLVLEVLEWAADGEVEDDPAADYYVPTIPLTKPELLEVVRNRELRSVSAARRPRRRCPGSEDQTRARVVAEDGVGSRVRGRARRSVHQRSRSRQHPEGRHLLGRAADRRRRDDLRPVASPGRCRGPLRGTDDQDHRWAADRSARCSQAGSTGGLARSRHALRPRVWQELPDGENVRRIGLLPLRPRRQHRARDPHRGALRRAREPREAQARRCGLSAELLGGDGQGRRSGRCRGCALGDLRRRCGRRARPQG